MNTPRVTRLATILYWATSLSLILFPALIIIGMVTGTPEVFNIRAEFAQYRLPEVLSLTAITATYAVEAILIGAAIFAMIHMRALFALYAQGITLTPACGHHIKRIGQSLVFVGAFGILGHTLQVLALTMGNPPGQRQLSFGISDTDIALLLAGGLMLLIGWVMGQAAQLAEENEAFV